MIAAIVVAVLLVIMALILIAKLNIVVEYNKDGHDDNFVLSFFIYGGLVKYKYEIPKMGVKGRGLLYKKIVKKNKTKKDDKKKYMGFSELIEKIEEFKQFRVKYNEILSDVQKYLKCKIRIQKLNLSVFAGTGNAMYTGILSGLLWTGTGILISFLRGLADIKENKIEIKPDFVGKKLKIDLYCIFKVRIVHIIVIGIMILKNMISLKFSFFNTKRSING